MFSTLNTYRTSLVAQTVKHLAYNAGDLGSILGLGRSSGEGSGNPLQYSCLENPMDRRAWWATVHWITESDTTERLHFHFIFSKTHFFLDFFLSSIIFSIVLLLISALIFISSLRLMLAFICSSFSDYFRCKVSLFICDFSYILR